MLILIGSYVMPAFRVRFRLRSQSRLPLLLRLLLLRAANIVIFTIFFIVQTLIFDPICFIQAMPPVRRLRAARPTTRAVKKSRPTGQLSEEDLHTEQRYDQPELRSLVRFYLCRGPAGCTKCSNVPLNIRG